MSEEQKIEIKRRPYHERYYLLYGNEEKCPENNLILLKSICLFLFILSEIKPLPGISR